MSVIKWFKKYNKIIREETGEHPLKIYPDIFWSYLRYGAGPFDYFKLTFYNFSNKKRKTFITAKKSEKLYKENSHEITLMFGNKAEFLRQYQKFTKRGWVDTSRATYEEFASFVKEKKRVFIKPLWLCEGVGAEIYEYKDDASLKAKYEEMKKYDSTGGMLVEELIKQHPNMKMMGENSVNTIRVATYKYNGVPHILGCTLRMGGDGCIDNYDGGGTCATVDTETGVVNCLCFRDEMHRTVRHPFTGNIVLGFEVPNWEKVKQICLDAANYKEGANYIGWDVAVLEDDVLLVEANCNHGIFQAPDKIGKYEFIKQIRKGTFKD